MLKKITLISVCFLLIHSAKQTQAQVMSGFGLETGIPIGELRSFADVSIGLGAEFRVFPIERIAFGVHVSWQYYLGGTTNFSMISLRGKAEYFFTDEGAIIRPFVGIEPGLYIASYTGNPSLNFGFSPTGGVFFALSDYVTLAANVRYNFIFDNRTAMYAGVGLSLIYTIQGNKRR